MVTPILDNQRNAPIYNIKAVARLTGVAADTLRRWESRYAVISPERTESGYRLYSQRHVDTILWLKAKLESGMSISRASEMLRQMGGDPGPQAPPAAIGATPGPRPPAPATQEQAARSFPVLQASLMAALRSVDEPAAGEVLTEALSLYSVEDVCLKLIQPTLIEVGQAWLDGEISVAIEHFASSFARARLENIFHSSPHNMYGPLVIVGCAPEELHEIGAMFLAIFLRRAGYRVIYLGQNVPMESLQGMIQALKPHAVCISATRAETAASLYGLRAFLDRMKASEGRAPLLAYGGQVFNRFPHITERLGGFYLGEDVRAAVRALDEQLKHSYRIQ
jgi:DNA-binding transcriptional MerR regulator/methylmalonyl-CoA mutase cobalamin-binding subunit